tara:strand:- start:117 stop:281 length:165 start_codon:yes stop_codon:yes gene_type:complete
MTLDEVQQKKAVIEKQLQAIPLLRDQYNRLCGMEELLLEQQKESEKPDLKVANK